MKKIFNLINLFMFFILFIGCKTTEINVSIFNNMDTEIDRFFLDIDVIHNLDDFVPTKKDCYFYGWYTDNTFKEKMNLDNIDQYIINDNLYLYAKFLPNEYKDYYHLTITYDQLIEILYQKSNYEIVKFYNTGYWINIDGVLKPYCVKDFPKYFENNQESSKLFKIELRSDLLYNVSVGNYKKSGYNGKLVESIDYLTPFKFTFNMDNNVAFGKEFLDNYDNHIVGLKAYYNKEPNVTWDDVKVNLIENNTSLLIEFEDECTVDYVIEYLSSPYFSPIPESFLCSFSSACDYDDLSEEIIMSYFDSLLFVGPYVPFECNENEIILEQNMHNLYYDFEYEGIYIEVIY